MGTKNQDITPTIERRIINGKNLKIEERSIDGKKKRVICGYSAVYNRWSEVMHWFKEKIEPGAFSGALNRTDTRGLFNHDSNYVLGRKSANTLELSSDDEGLWLELYPPDTAFARDLMISIERGDIREQSFGFTVTADKWERLDEDIAERTILTVGELYDVGPVTFAAYPDTSVAARSFEKTKNAIAQRSVENSRKRAMLDIDKRIIDLTY